MSFQFYTRASATNPGVSLVHLQLDLAPSDDDPAILRAVDVLDQGLLRKLLEQANNPVQEWTRHTSQTYTLLPTPPWDPADRFEQLLTAAREVLKWEDPEVNDFCDEMDQALGRLRVAVEAWGPYDQEKAP